jgi:tryptophan 2,3-dioxygenase
MTEKQKPIHYQTYLQLDKILQAQELRSAEVLDGPAHDETLFIIIHQVYELWFKQIIHELQAVLDMFNQDRVDERNIGLAVADLDRVIEIQKVLVQQIRVLDTMTSQDFLEFRSLLFPASGFQSFQFRLIEVMLGLKETQRATYGKVSYTDFFTEEQTAQLKKIENGKSLLEAVAAWLERTPFLVLEGFDFLDEYENAVRTMFSQERNAVTENHKMLDDEKTMRLEMINDNEEFFNKILDRKAYDKLLAQGIMKLSHKATIAALLINLYQDEPILQMPYNLLQRLISIDELFTTWRYRHAQMTMNMLGKKPGTGGSSGYDYLLKTASKHHVFKDFHNITTFLIPRSSLPALPPEVKKQLGFYFTEKSLD